MSDDSVVERSGPFLEWLAEWKHGLKALSLSRIVPDPERLAVMSVDVIIGFCTEGSLSSPRVAGIVEPVASLLTRAYEAGVRKFLFFQDAHDENAPEFEAYGSHCVAGSRESQMVPELARLPFAELFDVRPKNSISSAIGTGLDEWLETNRDVDRFIVAGDCTDLCVYQLAMHLRITANAANIERTVIVPADCVDTYDMPPDSAAERGLLPHDGELLHSLFCYHMALNGIEVVAGIV